MDPGSSQCSWQASSWVDTRGLYKLEIERFNSALASLAEIVAFVVLGLTMDVNELGRPDVWIPGLILGVVARRRTSTH